VRNNRYDYIEFSNLHKECKILSLHCNSNYILRLENKILTNIKPFWNYIQKLKSNKTPISENMSNNNTRPVD